MLCRCEQFFFRRQGMHRLLHDLRDSEAKSSSRGGRNSPRSRVCSEPTHSHGCHALCTENEQKSGYVACRACELSTGSN